MNQYLITYDNGLSDTVNAAKVDKNFEGNEYRLLDGTNKVVAYIPAGNALSIVLLPNENSKTVTG
ncbi:hypothetical protein OG875_04810 [Streptomyces sp. NBC_01498]|uniref:hypothetical protein n=1 Tax=Streptomyces sp. NBC_01498 TaxID=2975870 RepID=UPI002E7ADEFC|nr:hypothetical protein [Streptomyces sp. NBC_01498]WTL23977.1 hypothetical protein OG875_04810 [Streptomyces sp. NBC_01498]